MDTRNISSTDNEPKGGKSHNKMLNEIVDLGLVAMALMEGNRQEKTPDNGVAA